MWITTKHTTYNDWEAIIKQLNEKERFINLEFVARNSYNEFINMSSDEWKKLCNMYNKGCLYNPYL